MINLSKGRMAGLVRWPGGKSMTYDNLDVIPRVIMSNLEMHLVGNKVAKQQVWSILLSSTCAADK